ncbi:Vascular endothelial growth factor receptor 1 [Portunus trituberculatus]|uniref:Vascular endothelial growth factor receptor 1 n=1 Tax=Portunus trituberculatus TaxID=210409 RepID=A0A5B7G4X5_PORTR|nr:Vascular endothelial growth factor receptor 1 [Portunus trituberculatus]
MTEILFTAPGLNQTGRLILAISVVGLAIFGIIIGFLIHRVRKEQEINNPYRMRAKEFFENGNVGSLNLTSTADKQAEMLPYDKKKWEVPLANITFGRQLGSGAFGRVIKATVTGLQGPATTTVAIKTCKNDVDAAQKAIISELKIMMHLGAHLNIVNLLGANTEHLLGGCDVESKDHVTRCVFCRRVSGWVLVGNSNLRTFSPSCGPQRLIVLMHATAGQCGMGDT